MVTLKFSDARGSTSGTFTRGSAEYNSNAKPLLVLIHGGGVNNAYFDNVAHSIPRNFSSAGYNVLNLARVGYGGNAISKSSTPLFEAVPVYADYINQVYKENHGGKGGVILIGHSLGAATSLIIAALEGDNIPLIGVSALGCVPKREPPQFILDAIAAFPDVDRLEMGDVDDDYFRNFLGAPEYFDVSGFARLSSIYEGAPKNELVEWTTPATYDRFVSEVAPGVKVIQSHKEFLVVKLTGLLQVPLQFLAAEIELGWSGIEQGIPIFEETAKWFTNTEYLDAGILLGGAHNYEFSKNSQRLHDRRLQFIESITRDTRS